MTVKKPTGSEQSESQEKSGTSLLKTGLVEKLSEYQRSVLDELLNNEEVVDRNNAEHVARAIHVVSEVIPAEKRIEYPQIEGDTPEERAYQKALSLRHAAISNAAQAYQHAVSLGENGELVGKNIVDAARVIERYLSGNSD